MRQANGNPKQESQTGIPNGKTEEAQELPGLETR